MMWMKNHFWQFGEYRNERYFVNFNLPNKHLDSLEKTARFWWMTLKVRVFETVNSEEKRHIPLNKLLRLAFLLHSKYLSKHFFVYILVIVYVFGKHIDFHCNDTYAASGLFQYKAANHEWATVILSCNCCVSLQQHYNWITFDIFVSRKGGLKYSLWHAWYKPSSIL